jgi:PAS domain S-box-containing protein
MNIRFKTLAINSLALAGVVIIVYTVATPYILHGFEKVENTEMHKNVKRATDAVDHESKSLGLKLQDWASWDDTYTFVQDHNKTYIHANFADDPDYESPIYDTIIFYNRAGKLVYENGINKIADDLKSVLTPGSRMLKYSNVADPDPENVENGIVVLPKGIFYVSARPILTSDMSGPSQGTLIFGKQLSEDSKADLASVTHLDIDLYTDDDKEIPQDAQAAKNVLKPDAIQTDILGDNKIAGYAYIQDITGKPAILARVLQNRDIYNQGQSSVRTFLGIILVAGLVSALITAFMLEIMVLSRVTSLTRRVARIKDKKDYKQKLQFRGKDEVATLAIGINLMLSRIKTQADREAELLEEIKIEKAGVENLVLQRTSQLEHEKSRFLASINSLPIGFMLIDEGDDVLMFNPTLKTVLKGYTVDKNMLSQVATGISPALAIILEEAHQSAKSGKVRSSELTTEDGRYLHVLTAPVLARTQKTEGIVILIEDITEEKAIERSKDEFFSIASHELRTPLTSIKGNSSMILDFYQEVLKDEQLKEMVEDMHTSSIRLIDIVNDFLEVSRLEQGKMSFTYAPTQVEKVLESVAYEMRAVLTEKKLYLKLDSHTLDSLPMVWVDKNRLKQVVYNLVGNSAKFTEKGGITVSAKLDSRHGFIKVLVADTGRGMTPKSQQLLFHKFQQASSSLLTRDTTRGTGLGLYISKMIVESMGGVIGLEESIEGKGSVFSFTVPITTDKLESAAKAQTITETDSATGLAVSKKVD